MSSRLDQTQARIFLPKVHCSHKREAAAMYTETKYRSRPEHTVITLVDYGITVVKNQFCCEYNYCLL